MVKEAYKLFRLLAFICLIVIMIISSLYYFDFIKETGFAISSGIIAILATIFGALATKPVEEDDVEVAIDKVLLTYDKDTFQQLKEAKEQHKELVDFIEHRSNEIFLLKLRSYLQEEIETKFQNSELAKLIKDLEEVETQWWYTESCVKRREPVS
jgi:light-regulated signal transduction histidine kinase (bacteriophytochrome)